MCMISGESAGLLQACLIGSLVDSKETKEGAVNDSDKAGEFV
jgi:hypothetical protein